MMRWEAHNLEMLFHIYKMVMRPLENFLKAFEIESWLNSLDPQKVAQNMDFWVSH